MSHLLLPTKIKGGRKKAETADDSTQQLLERILVALNTLNIQLALMTDTVVDEGEHL